MKRWKLAAIAALATAAVCLAVTFAVGGIFEGDADSLTLWYTQGDCSAGELGKMERAYRLHSFFGGGGITARVFENEEALAEAFNEATPDLLLCSYDKAADLSERGLLSKEKLQSLSVAEGIAEAAPLSGSEFFPLGSRTQILVANSELCRDKQINLSLKSLEELMEAAEKYSGETGKAAFSAQSYAQLIEAELCSLGAEFSGDTGKDSESEDFVYIYNLLAEAGYEDAILALGDESADYVQAGQLPFACVSSSKLPELDMSKVTATALPLPEKGEKRCPAELLGFAVTGKDENKNERVFAFLEWLHGSGEDEKLATGSGLIPADGDGSRGGHRWAALLAELGRDYEPIYQRTDSQSAAVRDDFDKSFGQTLDLLR